MNALASLLRGFGIGACAAIAWFVAGAAVRRTRRLWLGWAVLTGLPVALTVRTALDGQPFWALWWGAMAGFGAYNVWRTRGKRLAEVSR